MDTLAGSNVPNAGTFLNPLLLNPTICDPLVFLLLEIPISSLLQQGLSRLSGDPEDLELIDEEVRCR